MSALGQGALAIAVRALIELAPPAWHITNRESAVAIMREALDEIAYIDFLYANADRRPFGDDDLSFLHGGLDADASISRCRK